MSISNFTRARLEAAQDHCEAMGKSTEFMIQFMQDEAGTDHDTVMEFLYEQSQEGGTEDEQKRHG